jgi:hypothetical protein
MGILGSVSISVFSGLANSISLDKDTSNIASYIDKARTMSINSVNSLEHGVLFATKKVTVFKTTIYSVANTEAFYDVSGKSNITAISLTGGATSLFFNKLTGAASKTGTITVTSTDGTKTKTITIYGTGIVDIQ